MSQGDGNLVGIESAVSEAVFTWPGLDAVQGRLQRDKYSILEEEGVLIARRASWTGLGDRREYFFIFRSFSSINRGELIHYLDVCKIYASSNEKWHVIGYIVSAVAICEKVSEDAIRYAVDYNPSKEPPETAVPIIAVPIAAPIIVDSGRNQVYYFQKVPRFRGAYVCTKMQEKIRYYLCEKHRSLEPMTPQAPANVCPQCGSSNINKAIQRWPKSQQEIEFWGFKCEWACLCFSCRYNWVERELI